MSNLILLYCCIGIFLIMLSTVCYYVINHMSYIKRQSYVDKHEHYTKILDTYLEKAYDLIYKDRILVYSIEGVKPSEEDIKQYAIDFAKLTLKLLGSTLTKEFVYLYGDEDTFIFSIIEYFNSKSEHDEIRQSALDNIMDD